jgi:hypothetical protein
MTKCAACIEWEAKGGTVLQCNTCGQPADEERAALCWECHQPMTGKFRTVCEACVQKVTDFLDDDQWPPSPPPNDALRELMRTTAPWVKDNCVQPKPPLTEREHLHANNIARALNNLNDHEKRLGASRWHP